MGVGVSVCACACVTALLKNVYLIIKFKNSSLMIIGFILL